MKRDEKEKVFFFIVLKGVKEDSTWGYVQKPLESRLSPSVSSIFDQFRIPYSAIAKTILVRSLIFHIFTRRVEMKMELTEGDCLEGLNILVYSRYSIL